jgi:hypothetical protein
MSRWFDSVRVLPLVGVLALVVGCETQGPAEQAGENLDNAANDVGDALDSGGPAEETGEALDNTLGN